MVSTESPFSLGTVAHPSPHVISQPVLPLAPKAPHSLPAPLRCLSLNLHPRRWRSVTLPRVLQWVALQWGARLGGVQKPEVLMVLAAGQGCPSQQAPCMCVCGF